MVTKTANSVDKDDVIEMSNSDLLSCVKRGGQLFSTDDKNYCHDELITRIKNKKITAHQLKEAELPPSYPVNTKISVSEDSITYRQKYNADLFACKADPHASYIPDDNSDRNAAIALAHSANSIQTTTSSGLNDYNAMAQKSDIQDMASGAMIASQIQKVINSKENAKRREMQFVACMHSRNWDFVYDTYEAEALKSEAITQS